MIKKKLVLAVATLLGGIQAHAADLDNLRISGFGTVGSAFNRNRDADFRANNEQNQGVGTTTTRDYGLDAVFAVQADLKLLEKLTATAQLQSRRESDGSSTPYFEWANFKYRITPDLSLRIGRVVAPFFLWSESRAVGYAQTQARLPVETYSVVPIRFMDGTGVNYNFTVADFLISLNFITGKLNQSFFSTSTGNVNYKFRMKDLTNVALESGSSKFRIGYGEINFDAGNAKIDSVDAALTKVANVGLAGAQTDRNTIKYQNINATFLAFAYAFDNGRYLFQAEATRRHSSTILVQDMDSYYLLAGYHFKQWTPFIQYSKSDSKKSKASLETIANPINSQKITDLNTYIDSLRKTTERDSIAIGARWDFRDNYDIKLQYDHVRKPENAFGFFANATPEFAEEKRTVNVYSISLDYVF